ncbi:MAG: DUF2252 family protein [Solibacillus sp.]
MEQVLLEGVKTTRQFLRKQQLATIFEQFDVQTMQLTTEQRLEKYKKMAESPFRFFRGSAYLYYYDTTKIDSIFHTDPQRPTWIMGDMHMDNFGAFQNEEGDVVFDVNDFDEGYVGSYLYDILRMSISIALYMEEQQLSEDVQQQAINSFLTSYIKQMKRFKSGKDDPITLIFTKDNTKGPIRRALKKLEQRQHTQLLEDLTVVNELGQRIFVETEEIHRVSGPLFNQISALLGDYAVQDIALKYGSGTASIGLERYYIVARDAEDAEYVLEMKEVRTAVPAYFFPYNELFWQHYEHQGARVVGTQKAMHHLEDPHLTYATMNGKEYYIRERSPYKRKVKSKNYRSTEEYFETTAIMGQIAAKIHARADIDYSDVFTYHSEDEILEAIEQHKALFVDSVTMQVLRYKDIVNYDYELFIEWLTTLNHA